MSRLAVRLFALVAYAAFLGVFVGFIGFASGVALPRTVDDGASASPLAAVAIDLLLVIFFGAAHSLMARERFKRMWTRIVPPAAERSFYVLVASAQVALLMWQWRPLPAPLLWSVSGSWALALGGLQALGWATLLASSFLIDHFEMFGLRQAFGPRGVRSDANLRTPFLYRWVRHPLYLGLLIGLWAPRTMSPGHLLLAAFMTAYLLIGVHHEEKDLVRRFGDAYRRYQETVPRLLPWPRPRQRALAEGSASK